MSLFNIDHNRLIKQLLPYTLRKARIFWWLRVLIIPVVYIYNLFKNNRGSNLYFLSHTSQVISMQAVLNDTFNNSLDVIRIIDDVSKDLFNVYVAAENAPFYTYTVAEHVFSYLHTVEESIDGAYDFIVKVPSGLAYNSAHMRALINRYRLPGKCNYTIQTI